MYINIISYDKEEIGKGTMKPFWGGIFATPYKKSVEKP